MKQILTIGQRVNHPYLGDGVIQQIKDFRGIIVYLVLFDRDPDFRYNLGQNPTFVFQNEVHTL